MPQELLELLQISIDQVNHLRQDVRVDLAELDTRLCTIADKLRQALETKKPPTEHPNTV